MTLDAVVAARLPLISRIDSTDAVEDVASRFAEFAAPVDGYRSPDVDCQALFVAGPHGPIPVRAYRPLASLASLATTARAGLVWMHGGAFVSGDADMVEADVVAREVCARAEATVVSVDYRLALDGIHYPVPLDDVLSAWLWTWARAESLGIDPQRLAIGGASAGACLAASAALRLRDEALPEPAALILAYPTVHLELPSPSAELAGKLSEIPSVMRFPASTIAQINQNYLGGAERVPYAMPGDEPLTGLPPTLVVTCEYDDLRASGEAFADSLAAAGVQTTLRCEPGVLHGHLNIPGLPGALATIDAMVSHLLAPRATDDRPAELDVRSAHDSDVREGG